MFGFIQEFKSVKAFVLYHIFFSTANKAFINLWIFPINYKRSVKRSCFYSCSSCFELKLVAWKNLNLLLIVEKLKIWYNLSCFVGNVCSLGWPRLADSGFGNEPARIVRFVRRARVSVAPGRARLCLLENPAATYAFLAYDACTEIANFNSKAEHEGCATWSKGV